MRLKGKIALVTGAAQGIGAATAERFAEEGAFVFMTDIKGDAVEATAQKIRKAGGKTLARTQDVAEEKGWADAVKWVETEMGGLDVLVHNAGVELFRPIEEITFADWRRTLSIDVDAIFLGSRDFIPLMKKRAAANKTIGSIIVMSSVAGMVAFPKQLAYTTSKGAVRHMTKGLAIELAQAGANIRVNSVHPGFIKTPMMEEIIVDWAREGVVGTHVEAEVEHMIIQSVPMKTWIYPVDIANGVVFLASDESRFMTGSELVIDAGMIAQ